MSKKKIQSERCRSAQTFKILNWCRGGGLIHQYMGTIIHSYEKGEGQPASEFNFACINSGRNALSKKVEEGTLLPLLLYVPAFE